jgi:phosphocarrier protein
MRNDIEASACGRRLPGPLSVPMLNRTVQIINPLGLHLRAAEKFVGSAKRFLTDIWIVCNGRCINGKSLLDIAMLAAECGSRIELQADGPDAGAALDTLAELIGRGFDEL